MYVAAEELVNHADMFCHFLDSSVLSGLWHVLLVYSVTSAFNNILFLD